MPITSNNTNAFAETVSGGGGGSGTPASTVVTQTSYGQSSAVGTSTDYARADHSHGTPATVPSPFNTRCAWAYPAQAGPGITAYPVSWPANNTITLSGDYVHISGKMFATATNATMNNIVTGASLPFLRCVILTDTAIATASVACGTGENINSSQFGTNIAQFMFDTNVFTGQTNWYFVTTDNTYYSSLNVTVIDTGVPYTNNTVYTMDVQWNTTSSIQASINGTVVATSNTFTPDATVDLVCGVNSVGVSTFGFNRFWIQEGH